jgi:hypothetical protein
MNRVISIHEYRLRNNVSGEQFEATVEKARKLDLFNLPGLIDYHFLKRIRGSRNVKFTAVWIYQNREAWEKLWGEADSPIEKNSYPENWKRWENEFLAPLLTQDPDRIDYIAYVEF